jgi:hypothetical protein
VGDFYGGVLATKPPPNLIAIIGLALGSMVAGLAILAGAPIVVGLADLANRWRERRDRFALEGRDLMFLLLLFSAAATLAMVAIFASKVAWTPSETKRLWGRYFEFFAPLLWLATAPVLARPMDRGTALACAAVMVAGVAGLLASFHAGIVLFPWDASALGAFFHPDPVRAPLGVRVPYRALAVAASLLAAAALALRARPALAGLGLILALGVLSTHLDHLWLGPIVGQRNALARDMVAIGPKLPPAPAALVLLAPDANEGHLGFLEMKARPRVWVGPPSQAQPDQLAGAQAVVVSGPETPPGAWTRTYQGEDLSLFQPAGVR